MFELIALSSNLVVVGVETVNEGYVVLRRVGHVHASKFVAAGLNYRPARGNGGRPRGGAFCDGTEDGKAPTCDGKVALHGCVVCFVVRAVACLEQL